MTRKHSTNNRNVCQIIIFEILIYLQYLKLMLGDGSRLTVYDMQ